jgi:hypothetical protein
MLEWVNFLALGQLIFEKADPQVTVVLTSHAIRMPSAPPLRVNRRVETG